MTASGALAGCGVTVTVTCPSSLSSARTRNRSVIFGVIADSIASRTRTSSKPNPK